MRINLASSPKARIVEVPVIVSLRREISRNMYVLVFLKRKIQIELMAKFVVLITPLPAQISASNFHDLTQITQRCQPPEPLAALWPESYSAECTLVKSTFFNLFCDFRIYFGWDNYFII